MNRVLRTALAVGENVGIPVGTYLVASGSGVPPVWALVVAAAASLVVTLVRWAVTRTIATLGVLVLVRFLLGVAVAVVTGDARLEIVKDLVITGLIGVVAVLTTGMRRPLIARIRRDLSGDPDGFDRDWRQPGFRSLHRRLTGMWGAGLVGWLVVGTLLTYSLPLTWAVVVTNTGHPAVIIGLVVATEAVVGRWRRRHDGSTDQFSASASSTS